MVPGGLAPGVGAAAARGSAVPVGGGVPPWLPQATVSAVRVEVTAEATERRPILGFVPRPRGRGTFSAG
jgi:hypothetical protein